MSVNEVVPFQYSDGSNIRVIRGEDGEPWFIGQDVAAILGYQSPDKAYKHCKYAKIFTNAISAGLHPSVKVIPESANRPGICAKYLSPPEGNRLR